jgi:hypothetical protein
MFILYLSSTYTPTDRNRAPISGAALVRIKRKHTTVAARFRTRRTRGPRVPTLRCPRSGRVGNLFHNAEANKKVFESHTLRLVASCLSLSTLGSLNMATLNDEKDSRGSHIESADNVSQTKEVHTDMKLDAHGLPLIPQPSDNKDDPLVCRQNIPCLPSDLTNNSACRIGLRGTNTMFFPYSASWPSSRNVSSHWQTPLHTIFFLMP